MGSPIPVPWGLVVKNYWRSAPPVLAVVPRRYCRPRSGVDDCRLAATWSRIWCGAWNSQSRPTQTCSGLLSLRRPSEDTYTSTLQLAQLSDHLAGLVGMSGESGSGPAWSWGWVLSTDETADDGLAAAGIVRILNDRQDQSCRVTRVPAVGQNSIGRTCKPKSRQIVPT